MERIAIIADIHANLEALKTVLKDIEEKGIKRIFCLGDIIGKGAHPKECIDLVLEKCEVILIGNLEDFVLKETKNLNEINASRQAFYQKQIGSHIDKIKNLAFSYEFYMSGSLIRLLHASPSDVTNRINNLADHKAKIKEFYPTGQTISQKTADVLIFADLHSQFMEKFYNKTMINCGSVGCPTDIIRDDAHDSHPMETTQAFYLIVEGEMDSQEYNNPLSFNFIRVPYDIEKELATNNELLEKEDYQRELREAKYRDIHLLKEMYDL